ncbi:tetratricopeptide repeat protein [Mesorhizobium atlanticum]
MRSRKGDSAGAAADCRKAIALDPKKTRQLRCVGRMTPRCLRRKRRASRILRPLAKQLEAAGGASSFQRGCRANSGCIEAAGLRRRARARSLPFGYAISLDPDNAEAHYDRAVAAASQGDNALAASDCRRAVELDPQRAGACAALMAGGQTVPAAGTQDQAPQDQASARILVERAGARLAK